MTPALWSLMFQGVMAGIPEFIALFKAIAALRTKYPAMTPEQIAAICQAAALDVQTTTAATDAALDAELKKTGN